jgi:hypothetical protein
MTKGKNPGAHSPGTFLDALLAVFKPARLPLTARDITIKAINERLLGGSAGKSPERTTSSALCELDGCSRVRHRVMQAQSREEPCQHHRSALLDQQNLFSQPILLAPTNA